jgi:protein-S-isoprenylcysteine O-methyltransferase Ste14
VTLTAIVVVVLAVTAALVYNRVAWRPRQASGRASQHGVSLEGIIALVGTLAVLLLAFVLVQTYASWSAAGEAETAEATATLLLFREADLVKDAETRNRLRAAVVCYATSVIRQEWPAMQDRQVSNVPTYWGARIREAGVRLTRTSAEQSAGENIVARDGERASARQERLGEARPTVPAALFVLMVVAVAVTLGIVGVATEASVGRGVHAVLVVATGVVLAATLLLVRDLDQPYAGLLRRSPSQTEFIRAQIAPEVRGALPCDDDGMPTRAPDFRASTSPLR